MKKSKKELTEDLLDAALNFILKYHPKGFNEAYFFICCSSGRFEEATKLLNEFELKE